MHMVFTDYTTFNMYLKTFTRLANQLSVTLSYCAFQHVISIHRGPKK